MENQERFVKTSGKAIKSLVQSCARKYKKKKKLYAVNAVQGLAEFKQILFIVDLNRGL